MMSIQDQTGFVQPLIIHCVHSGYEGEKELVFRDIGQIADKHLKWAILNYEMKMI